MDQNRTQYGEELLDAIIRFVEQEDGAALEKVLEGIHEADIADILRELDDGSSFILGILDPERASEVLSETGEDFRAELLEGLDDDLIRAIFHAMADDDAADIVGKLPEEETERILGLMKREDKEDVKVLLEYDEESAGGIMTSDLIAISEDLNVGQAMKSIRKRAREIEDFHVVFVVDRNNVLRGTVSLRDLILGDPETQVSRIMDSDLIHVEADLDQEEVARIMKRYNLVTVPVVDESGVLIGRITVDDILDIVEAEVTEDLLRMGGADVDEEIYGGTKTAVRFRLPWLFLNLFTALLAASVVGLYADTIRSVVVLAIFMPIIAGMGGNAATQSLAGTLRRLTLGEVSPASRMKIIRKELLAGLSNGLVVGCSISLVALLLGENPYMGLVVGLAMFLTIGLAGLIGAFIPITLKDFGVDPAVASSVIITTFTDLIGFFLLLGLATLLLGYLI